MPYLHMKRNLASQILVEGRMAVVVWCSRISYDAHGLILDSIAAALRNQTHPRAGCPESMSGEPKDQCNGHDGSFSARLLFL